MGLASLILGEQNPFAQFVAQNKNTIHGLGAGLASGQNISQGLSNAAQQGVAGNAADDAYAVAQKADAERQAAIQQQAALRQKYAAFFQQQNAPDYARAVSDGIMDPGAAYGDWMKSKSGTGGGPYDGTSMDAQNWNIVLKAKSDPTGQAWNDPTVQAAWAQLNQPQISYQQTPQGLMPIYKQPTMPPGFGPPSSAPSQPQQDGFTATSPDTAPVGAFNGDSGVQTGQVIPGTASPLNEIQSKDVYFATTALGALPVLDKLGDNLTSLGQKAGSKVLGETLGNYVKSADYQQAENAGRIFVNSILRKDSGAALTAEENANYGRTFLPQPGDKAPVLAQKAAARKRAIAGLKAGLPPQAILALGTAEITSPSLMPQDTSQPSQQSKIINGTTYVQDVNGDWFEQ